MKKLAICIPTYNRKLYLDSLLREIFSQIIKENLYESVQVCISDNCSTDGTDELVSSLVKEYVAVDFVYHKNESNIGAEKNFLKCVEIAQTEFCWLMGSDDQLAPNAIAHVLEKLETHDNIGVMIGRRIACNRNLKPLFSEHWIKSRSDVVCDFGNENEVLELLRQFTSTTGMCSLISLIVFNKYAWDRIQNVDAYIGTLYIQTYICFSLLVQNHLNMVYTTEQIVYARIGNDGFYESIGQRIMMDIKGFLKISDAFNEKPKEKRAFLDAIARCYDTPFLCAWMLSAKKMDKEAKEVFSTLNYTQSQWKVLNGKHRSYILARLFGSIVRMLFVQPDRFYVYTRIALARFF